MLGIRRFYFSDCRAEEIFLEPGIYQLEVWGASGGVYNFAISRGLGGYASGILTLRERTKVFIHLGGQASDSTIGDGTGGCNGGGYTTHSGGRSGGGSTDIRLKVDSLYSRVIVAGGGGGTSDGTSDSGGYGGGLNGGNGTAPGYSLNCVGKGGGQETETTACADGTENSCPKGTFGYGGNTTGSYAGAGGGGWFGGSASNYERGGGGGSGYVFTESSAKVGGYLLGEEFYLSNTSLQSGVNLGNGYANIINYGCFNRYFNLITSHYKFNSLHFLLNLVSLLICV
jgi:hypothetical protein